MDRVGIEHLTVLGMPRLELVGLAADLGCRYISTNLASSPYTTSCYPPYSLRDDPRLRRELVAVMRDRGVRLALGEGFVVRPGADVMDAVGDLDLLVELGAPLVNVVSFDPDPNRTVDQFAALAQAAAQRGMQTTTEPTPGMTVADLPSALRVLDRIGRPDFRLVIDTMHLARSGSTAADLARLAPGVVAHIQLGDAPRRPRIPDYLTEATSERLVPGAGELPLLELLTALPREVTVGVEVPRLAAMRAGGDVRELVGQAVAATRALLARLPEPARSPR